jgi:secreted Zn-dependent insulinase-like peptidase
MMEGVTPDKSASDKKEYKLVTIGELEVLLVSNLALQSADNADGESAKGSAAMSVQVGSYADPEVGEGMAHFLEHMVFIGSEKYPNENHYDAFVTAHGGFCNAFTEGEFTAYQFDVDSESFAEGLDIFAQCFISPLLKKESVEREIKAINYR